MASNINLHSEKIGKRIKVSITTKNGMPLNLKLVKRYYTALLNKYNVKDENSYIRALSTLGFMTLKSLNESIESVYEDEEDYFDGRVCDNSKFTEFIEVQCILFT